mgnify:FL=1
MYIAMILVCSLVHVSGDEMSCFQVNDTLVPDGYATEKKCRVRVSEMASMISSVVPYPHIIKYKCENNTRRISIEEEK